MMWCLQPTRAFGIVAFFRGWGGFTPRHVGSYFPDQGGNPCPLRWKGGILTTGLPKKSLVAFFNIGKSIKESLSSTTSPWKGPWSRVFLLQFFKIALKFTRHKINHFTVSSSLAFSNHSLGQPPPLSRSRIFSSPQKETLNSLSSRSVTVLEEPVHPPCSPDNHYLLSVSTDFPVLGISYKNNHTICGLLCLASLTFPSPGDLPNPGIEPRSPVWLVDSLPAEPQGKAKNTGVGSLSLLQGIFLTQELNRGLLHWGSATCSVCQHFTSFYDGILTA